MRILDRIRAWDGPFTSKGKLIEYEEVHPYQVGWHYGKEGKPLPSSVHARYIEEEQYLLQGYDHGVFYRRHRRKILGLIGAGLGAATLFMRQAF